MMATPDNTIQGSTLRVPPLDLSHHFSQVTKNRQNSEVKSLYKYIQAPGMSNAAGGLPHHSYFPYDTLEASAARPERFTPPQAGGGGNAQKNKKPAEWHLRVPMIKDAPDVFSEIDLKTALQYGTAEGYPPLHSFLRGFVRNHLHPNVPYRDGPEIILSCGSTDGFGKTIEALTNPWNERKDWVREREGVLFEEFAYMNAVQAVKPRGLNVVTVAMDSDGMKTSGAGGLEDVLSNWDVRKGKRPHLMYTVTLGHNPTGSTTPIERRKEIYALCQKYDVIIIEDEPYWNLQFPSLKETGHVQGQNYNTSQGRSSGYPFLDSLVPSFLSLDVDGRVVRLDTFSKTIAPGCRLGWVTAQPAIIERLTRITEVSTQQPSGFVQVMVAQLLIEQQQQQKQQQGNASGWTLDGWVNWLSGLRDAYQARAHDMCAILEEGKTVAIDGHPGRRRSTGVSRARRTEPFLDSWSVITKAPMYDFHWPAGGMFIWVRIRYETHPLLNIYGAEKVCKALWFFLLTPPFLCLVAPGTMFAPTEASQAKAFQYMRICFAPMPEEKLADTSRRFVAGCRAFWQLDNFNDIPGLDEDVLPEMMGLQMC